LADAFRDVSLVVVRSGVPLGYDLRVRAAGLLHTLVRAGRSVGLPDEPERWPGDHPAVWVTVVMRDAGGPRPVADGEAPARSSPWALREAANELRIGVVVGGDDEVAEGAIGALLDQADYMDENGEFPAEDELAGYDAELARRRSGLTEPCVVPVLPDGAGGLLPGIGLSDLR
jgi:hypothetical protein